MDMAVMVAGSSDGNDSTVVSGDVDDEIVLVVASCMLLIESSGRIFDLTACADEGDFRDDVDDDEAISLRLRGDRKRKYFRFFWFFEIVSFCSVRYYGYNNHTHKNVSKKKLKGRWEVKVVYGG